jgi:hypothetical protein
MYRAKVERTNLPRKMYIDDRPIKKGSIMNVFCARLGFPMIRRSPIRVRSTISTPSRIEP